MSATQASREPWRFGLREVLVLLGAVLAFGLVAGFWTSRTYEGVVVGPNEEPVAGAFVALQGPDSVVTVTHTRRDGSFALALRPPLPAQYSLLICAPGLGGFYEHKLSNAGIDGVTIGLSAAPVPRWVPGTWRQFGWNGPLDASC